VDSCGNKILDGMKTKLSANVLRRQFDGRLSASACGEQPVRRYAAMRGVATRNWRAAAAAIDQSSAAAEHVLGAVKFNEDADETS
jgi:hypothetical protein